MRLNPQYRCLAILPCCPWEFTLRLGTSGSPFYGAPAVAGSTRGAPLSQQLL